ESEDIAFFVLRLSKINVEALDMELLMYHFFKSDTEVPEESIQRLCRFSGGIRAWSSIAELIPHIPTLVVESHALRYPLSLEQEQSDLFTDVTMKMQQTRTPVFLTVGITHIRITSVHTLNIAPGLVCRSAEIVLLADVSNMYTVQTGHETNEFIVRRSRQGDTISFTSPNRETIIRTIRAAKSHLKDQQMPLAEQFMRFSNVPATLLHISMLSVDVYDKELRGAP
ncbi:hypothetical protein BT96DRAFT_1059676, partial [Gymnopus androsaceus JB14]